MLRRGRSCRQPREVTTYPRYTWIARCQVHSNSPGPAFVHFSSPAPRSPSSSTRLLSRLPSHRLAPNLNPIGIGVLTPSSPGVGHLHDVLPTRPPQCRHAIAELRAQPVAPQGLP